MYFVNITYAAATYILLKDYQIETPQSYAMNSTNTASAISSVSDWGGSIFIVLIVSIIIIIILIILSSRSMGAAYL